MAFNGKQGKYIIQTQSLAAEQVPFIAIRSACLVDRDLLSDCIFPEWLHVYESFRYLSRCSLRFANLGADDAWRKYGEREWGLTVENARLMAGIEVPGGCSWVKCVLRGKKGHQGDEMLRCTRCRKVKRRLSRARLAADTFNSAVGPVL